MTVPAARSAPRSRQGTARRFAGQSAGVFLTALLAISATPAEAQVGAVVSVFSDDRFRGISLSDGRPVGILDLSYDAPGGLYGTVSGSVVDTRGEGLKPLGLALNGGYATRLRSGFTADVGIVHSRYSHYSGVSGRAYTEVYAGLAGKLVGARLSVSPDYLGASRWTLHGEVNGHVDLSERLLVDGEIGLLVPLGTTGYQDGSRPQLDARVGIARRLGPVTLHAAFTARSGGADIYATREHGRTAVIIGISTVL